MEKKRVEVAFATLDFYKYEKDGLTYYEFDATMSQPPEPMVNTFHGLKMLKSKIDRLVGIYFHEPLPLYEKLGDSFKYEAQELENGDFKITFSIA